MTYSLLKRQKRQPAVLRVETTMRHVTAQGTHNKQEQLGAYNRIQC